MTDYKTKAMDILDAAMLIEDENKKKERYNQIKIVSMKDSKFKEAFGEVYNKKKEELNEKKDWKGLEKLREMDRIIGIKEEFVGHKV